MTGPDRCRYCGGRVLWHGPGGLVFADGSTGHLGCYERVEAERQAARRELPASPSPGSHGPAEPDLVGEGEP
jgi:hypothetical protein